MLKFKHETELAQIVVSWLKDMRWEVYQEVKTPNGAIADIVATQNNIVWVVECKLSFSLNLIEQAINHRFYSNYISIAVPYARERNIQIIKHLIDYYGMGVFKVDYNRASEITKPQFKRKSKTQLLKKMLYEEQKQSQAGNNISSYFSPFKKTCKNIVLYVKNNPGTTVSQIIQYVEHHYGSVASAKGCILKWAQEGVIEGIELKYINGKYMFYVKE